MEEVKHISECVNCYCAKQCEEVDGESICGYLRIYYLTHTIEL
jgi:hypothetical protein